MNIGWGLRRRRRTTGILAALAVSALLMPAISASAAGASCTSTQLVPSLASSTVNQGLGDYTPLVRGKELLVRLYLTKPSCGDRQSISLRSATLNMAIPGSPTRSYSPLDPLTSPFPPLPKYSTAPALDASSDPKFVVPGPDFVASSTGRVSGISFSATIGFTTSLSSTLRTTTFQLPPVVMEQQSKALRILVVPLGGTLTSGEVAVVQAGLNSLARMLPVPKAGGQLTGPLSAASSVGGIRYAINSGFVTLPNIPFCGGLANFAGIKSQLAQFRLDWNAANPGATADVALGVGSRRFVNGASAGCAEGVASTNSAEAWVRLDDPGASVLSSGATMAMEVAHTFGAEGSWADPFSPTHSANTEADGGTNRAYNITNRSFLVNDRTAMRVTDTNFNNNSTVYEKRDYQFLLCRLGGQPNSDCTSTGTVGTVTGVGAGPRFIMAGTTDGTPQNTHVEDSFNQFDVAPTATAPASPYRLLIGTASDIGVPVHFEKSIHDDEASHESDVGDFAISVEFPLSANPGDIRFVYRPPGGGADVVLYSRTRNGTPTVGSLSVSGGGGGGGATQFTDNAVDDLWPARTYDGKYVVWSRSDGEGDFNLLAAPVESEANTSSPGPFGLEPAVNPAMIDDFTYEVAFVHDFSLYTTILDTSGESPTFVGTPEPIYMALEGPVPHNPSYSPDGTEIAFQLGGDIYKMSSSGETDSVNQLTTVGDASNPSWSMTPGDDRIAFTRDSGESPASIWAMDATEGVPTTELFENAFMPSWGTDGRIAFSETGSFTLRTGDASSPADTALLIGGDGDQTGIFPSYLEDGMAAFERQFCIDEEFCNSEIWMLEPGGGEEDQISVVGGFEGGEDPDPANLKLTLYYQCQGVAEKSVLALALEPTSIEGGEAQFDYEFDDTGLCGGPGGGTVYAVLTDGFTSSPFPGDPDFDPDTSQGEIDAAELPPVAAIISPINRTGQTPTDVFDFLQWERIPLQGEGLDQLGQLPDAFLSWTISGGGLTSPRTATGSTVDLQPLPPGTYTVVLRATDRDDSGSFDETSAVIHVLADSDRDGLSDDYESTFASCLGENPVTNPENASDDPDGDGIPNREEIYNDAGPCVDSAVSYSPTIRFDPMTLFVPSAGQTVTVFVTQDHGIPPLTSVTPGSVRLISIEGRNLQGVNVVKDVSGEAFSDNRAWSVTGTLGTAKFDRQGLNNYIRANFSLNQTLKFEIVGASSNPPFNFTGFPTTFAKKK